METVVEEWQLKDKLRYVVTDNASNMKKATSIMFPLPAADNDDDDDAVEVDSDTEIDDPSLYEDLTDEEMQATIPQAEGRRIPCFVHSLQLVVRDGLKFVGFARPAISKVNKLANIVRQSALFRSAYENKFGVGNKSIPATNETRWNSVFAQMKAVADLDQAKLSELLLENSQGNLVFKGREYSNLKELVNVLEPFAEATTLAQGEYTLTVSCVVPILLSLDRKLKAKLVENGVASAMVRQLLHGLHDRFHGLYDLLDVKPPVAFAAKPTKDLQFGDEIFLVAAALDPKYGFRFLIDHTGTPSAKDNLRLRIMGACCYLYCFAIPQSLNLYQSSL